MELNLLPQKADTTVFEGEGGGYYAWTAAKTPAVVEAAVGAGKFVLQPRGFALPHYADSNKIGYVFQGTCTVGLILPNNEEEKIIIINKGDAIPLQIGTISWWFNNGDSDFTIIFLGESRQSYTPGQFDYFLLAGAIGILAGFSTEFISNIYGLNDAQSKELAKSQSNTLIIKVGANIHMPNKSNCEKEGYAINLDALLSSNAMNLSGSPKVEITSEDSPLIDKIGLSPSLVRLEPETILNPSYSMEHRIIYVIKGQGRIQIVGLNGARELDEIVEEGQLIVVPKFFVAALLANQKGLEFFCVSTSSRPLSKQIAGNTSPYKALSSSVLEAALNVSPEFVNIFKSKV
ncbi:hypothetical protein C2S51_026838 [Perilla frutescens var. frutescens]|nr:hypothetical protein C2S51_026838 [Perilla frutescens var. frutescens]